jgi:hypothetical protein
MSGTACSMALVAGPVAAMMISGLATFLLAGRVSPRTLGSLGLLTVLPGFFLLLLVLVPLTPGRGWLAVLVFLGSLTVFKLMNRFESPR